MNHQNLLMGLKNYFLNKKIGCYLIILRGVILCYYFLHDVYVLWSIMLLAKHQGGHRLALSVGR